jgi:phytoene dehydrogenase-like protein
MSANIHMGQRGQNDQKQGPQAYTGALSELLREAQKERKARESNRKTITLSAQNKPNEVDVAVIGAGFGGLGAALSLAERGFKVKLFESLRYPGGCAGTFRRQGYHFDAGATLSSGFEPGQLFEQWLTRYRVPLALEHLNTVVRLRAPSLSLDLPSDPTLLAERLCALPGAPVESIKAFLREQERVSGPLWALLATPDLLPPWSASALLTHLKRSPRYLPLLKHIGRPLSAALKRFDLDEFKPLTLYLNALCQITSQCTVEEAEAPFALSTMDYYSRGSAHVLGGIGELAWGLCVALERAGGEVSLSDRVSRVERLSEAEGGGWRVQSRHGETHAKVVVGNVLPQALPKLLPTEELNSLPAWCKRAQEGVKEGWGAAMLYMVTEEPQDKQGGGAEHWQLIDDDEAPLKEGNHVFCSVSSSQELGRAPHGSRVITLSTHVKMSELLSLSPQARGERIHEIQLKMRRTFEAQCPQWSEGVYLAMSASPRTFERFTGRPEGFVGGAPRLAGLRQYLELSPRAALEGFYLVGDSVFPGQSTLATAIGGQRVAERVTRDYGRGGQHRRLT